MKMAPKPKIDRAREIREFLLANVANHPRDIVSYTMNEFGVTRTTVHRHINTLIAQQKLFKWGRTNSAEYKLQSTLDKDVSYPITPELSESEVWRRDFQQLKEAVPANVYDICYYGFTEIFNNAIDHSLGSVVHAALKEESGNINITIYDNGVGIFRKLKNAFGFSDERESMLQLSKGKLTTDPERHTGEGIFFSSRVFDRFAILANGLTYMRDNNENDWYFEEGKNAGEISTMIKMEIPVDSNRKLEDVFRKYADPDTSVFDRTHIYIKLSLSKEDRFVSRSQAKRVLAGLEKFKHIVLDFKDVHAVGQAFVDEVFRVFSASHPEIEITHVNANESIKFMIDRGLATASADKAALPK